jgi:hypothetical protein
MTKNNPCTCKYCGSNKIEMKVNNKYLFPLYYLQCEKCGKSGISTDNKQKAYEKWNEANSKIK